MKNLKGEARDITKAKVKAIEVKTWDFHEKLDLFVQVLKFTN